MTDEIKHAITQALPWAADHIMILGIGALMLVLLAFWAAGREWLRRYMRSVLTYLLWKRILRQQRKYAKAVMKNWQDGAGQIVPPPVPAPSTGPLS